MPRSKSHKAMERLRERKLSPAPIDPIIAKLKLRRLERKLSFAQLSAEIGYTYTTINYWERGITIPKLNQLQDWASFLGLRLTLEDYKSDQSSP